MQRRLIGGVRQLLGIRRPPRAAAAHSAFPADEPLATLPALVLDTETTGLNVTRDRIVSIGGLAYRGGSVEEAPPLDFLVHPGIRIPRGASAIHGIHDAAVATAPSLPLLWPAIQGHWHRRVLVGHNIGFDVAILRHEAERHRMSFHPPAAALDIGLLYAGLKPRAGNITLEGIAAEFGVTLDGRHTALGDAVACGAIWSRLLPALGRLGVATLGGAQALMRRQRDLIHGQGRAGWATDLLTGQQHGHG